VRPAVDLPSGANSAGPAAPGRHSMRDGLVPPGPPGFAGDVIVTEEAASPESPPVLQRDIPGA
jgi:hypothetical protein